MPRVSLRAAMAMGRKSQLSILSGRSCPVPIQKSGITFEDHTAVLKRMSTSSVNGFGGLTATALSLYPFWRPRNIGVVMKRVTTGGTNPAILKPI